MMKKYIFLLLFFIIVCVGVFAIKNNNSIVEVKQVFSTADLKSNCAIDKIIEENDNYIIKAYYPVTQYQNLNDEILAVVNKNIDEFKNEISNFEKSDNLKYSLQINFNSYEYLDYISFVFNIFVDTKGAHPNTYISSVNYNTLTKKVLHITDFVDMNKDFLTILSTYSYDTLKDNEKIISSNVNDMLKEGTQPKVENFDAFALDKTGFIVFFENYSVAPYVAGEFIVTIPYEQLKLKL